MKQKNSLNIIICCFTFILQGILAAHADNIMQLKEKQIVAESGAGSDTALFNYRVYRIFLKKEPKGFLVQELYKGSNSKATDPFILKEIKDLTNIAYAYYTEPVSSLSIDGKYTIWYENGQKMQEGHYINGKKDGFWTRWFSNGQKSAEGMYKQGKLEGFWRMWNIDGSNMNETYFKNGRLEAVLSDIKDTKNDSVRKFLKKANKEKNIWLEWDENGHLRSQVILVDGKKEGVWVSWDDKGKREMLGYYKDDKRDGLWRTFWLGASETKRSEGYYKNGKKEGVWYFWNRQNEKIKEEYYERGKLIKKVNFNK